MPQAGVSSRRELLQKEVLAKLGGPIRESPLFDVKTAGSHPRGQGVLGNAGSASEQIVSHSETLHWGARGGPRLEEILWAATPVPAHVASPPNP
jgi:hypothetical protein